METSLRPRILLGFLPLLLMLAGPNVAAQSMSSPTRLAVTDDGRILVSDYQQKSVFVLDGASLSILDILTISGRPLGVAWGGSRLFVGNDATDAVEVFRPGRKGGWRKLGVLGSKKTAIPNPMDIAVDEDLGLVFVLSGGERAVLVFKFDGQPVGRISGEGSVLASLTAPTAVAVDPGLREMYVSDSGDPATSIDARVAIYSYDGLFLGELSGESGQDGYEFSRPQGLAADGEGRLFLVDSLLGQVLVFERGTGAGVALLGSYGTDPGQLLLPLDVAIVPGPRDVLVTNSMNRRVEVFPQGGQLP